MTFIEKAVAKREAYLAAGYTCTDIEETAVSAKFVARDQYGVAREHVYGETALTTPLLEKAKAKAPKVEATVEEVKPPVKKTRKKRGE